MNTYYSNGKRKYAELSYESKYLLDPKYMTKRDMQHYYRYYNMTKHRSQFKKIIIIVLFICFFSYVFIDFNLKTKLIRLKDRFDFLARVDADYNITQAYFVDTPGCRMPYFNVSDSNIVQFMFKPRNYSCHKPLTRTDDNGASHLWLNMDAAEIRERYNVSDFGKARCYYNEFRRKNEQENQHQARIAVKLRPHQPLQIARDIEFLKIECATPEGIVFYKDFHFFAVDKLQEAARQQAMMTSAANVTHRFNFDGVSFNRAAQSSLTPVDGFNVNKLHSSKLSLVNAKHKSVTPAAVDSFNLNKLPLSKLTPTSDAGSTERVSVMVIGIDSVSRLNFQRQMRQSYAYIQRHLTHVEFWGYNKVGDNTYPNLMPALTGLDETELNISCLAPYKNANYDRCALIWRRFKDAGYQTAYAEDVASLGLFNYFRAGFKRQPTDYYLRPLLLEMEQHISWMQQANVELCKGGRRSIDVVLDMIRKLLPLLRRQLFFSFFWLVTLTHDFLNMPLLLDADLRQLLGVFEAAGILNTTVVLLMSDHGLRWGSFRETYQGMMEERQPLLIALYPRWMRQRYPAAIANLETNTRRLSTHYDLHATLLDLLDLRQLQAAPLAARSAELQADAAASETLPRGISLFLPIPPTRTCELAGIASHWCTCHQRAELPTNDARVQRAARYIVQLINEKLRPHPQCRALYLNSIATAIIAKSHHKLLQQVTSDYGIDITVRVQTKPGLGEFESTVRMSTYATALTGTISRINLYGSQSYCIDDYALKMFCYCHR